MRVPEDDIWPAREVSWPPVLYAEHGDQGIVLARYTLQPIDTHLESEMMVPHLET